MNLKNYNELCKSLLLSAVFSITAQSQTAVENYINNDKSLIDLTQLSYLKFDREEKGAKFDKQAKITEIENNYKNKGWTIDDLILGKGWRIGNYVPPRESLGAIFASKYDKGSNLYEVNIAFRGTRDSDDWLTNLDATKKPLIFKDNKLTGHNFEPYKKGEVHAGFLNAYNSVAQAVTNKLEALHSERPTANFLVRVAGHSLGGALATLSAAHVAQYLSSIGKKKANTVQLETYASPRVTGEKLSLALEEVLGKDNIIRIITKDSTATSDIVPSLPKTIALQVFKHTGKGCFLNLAKVLPLKTLHGLASYIEGFDKEKTRVCQ